MPGDKSKPHKAKSRKFDQTTQHPEHSTPKQSETLESPTEPHHARMQMPSQTRLSRLWGKVGYWLTANSIMAAFTVVIAMAAVIQALIYSRQLTEMRIENRAWLK